MIELLESRIAPAAILVFTDAAGDNITVKASKGTSAQLDTAVVRSGGNITAINLSSAIYEGSDFSIVGKRGPGSHGSGAIAVPAINASGTDLGVVSIDGDVGGGMIGSNTAGTPAVKSFSALSVGDSNTSLATLAFNGVVPSFTTKADIGPLGAVQFNGAALTGNLLGKAAIGGGLIGGSTSGGGSLFVDGSAGSITVKGPVFGGSADGTGAISVEGSATATKVAVGSLLGSAGTDTGSIRSLGPLGPITVAKFIAAGAGSLSGSIVSEGSIASVTVGQSILGNSANLSEIAAGAAVAGGALDATGDLGAVTIRGSAGAGGLYTIEADGNLTSVSISGDANGLDIGSGGNLGPVRIGGDMLASQVSAHGTGSGLALGSVTIHGSAHGSSILAGQVVVSTQSVDDNATMGKVAIGHIADTVVIQGGSASGVTSEVASVTIGGPAYGVTVNSNYIARLVVGGVSAPLAPGSNNDDGTFAGVAYDEV